jgi:sulfofructose kinase
MVESGYPYVWIQVYRGRSVRDDDRTIEVLVIGRACVDYISMVDRFPQEDTKVPLEMRLVEGGGQGATSSCCIARLGGRVTYVGRIGDDDEGRICLNRLNEFGVDTGMVEVVKEGATPVAYVFITKATGERTIIYERSSMPSVILSAQIKGLVARSHVLLLDPQVTCLAGELRSLSRLPAIVYDCERWREGMEEMMMVADYFIPSSEFLREAAEKIAGSSFEEKIRTLADMVSGSLVLTDGANGAYYLDDGRLYQVLPPRVKIRDTTGAGDNFHAAFALAVSRGSHLPEAVRFSVAVATLSCRDYGGRAGIPDFDEAAQTAVKLVMRTIGQ